MKRIVALAGAIFLLPGVIGAQQQATAEAKKEDRLSTLEERVRVLEEEIGVLREALKAVRTTAPQPATGAKRLLASTAGLAPGDTTPEAAMAPEPTPQAVQTYGGAGGAAAKALNPDISVIGDFLGAVGRNNVRRLPGLELHESEVGLQAILDPYARGDFFISFGEQGVSVEEGFITFTSLPAGFVAKVGKFRTAFGKVNTLHNHVLPWTDRPLVTGNLVGGEDGINDAGLSVTRILPAPGGIFLEGTAQVLRGDSADVFTSSKRSDASVVAHLRGYKDLSESTNVDLGFSYAHGHNDMGSQFITQLYGIDATIHWTPLRRAVYHNFVGRAEFIWSHRDQLSSLELPETQKAFGFYTSGDYRLSRHWTIGARYDRSGRSRQANLIDSGVSGLLTFWPSEFSQIRSQFRHTRYADGRYGDELLLQFQFSLGAHGAHPF